MRIVSIVIATLVAAAAQASAQKPEAPASAASRTAPLGADQEQAALAAALERGQALYGVDRAAWVATDDFVARVPDYRSQGVRGYIVERSGDGYAVTFYGGAADAPAALYRGEVRKHQVQSREVFAAAARPALTPAQRRLAGARDAAAAAVRGRPCGDSPFNSAVLPPAAPDGPIDVYMMTPQVRERAFPVGGHFRLTVGPDGQVSGERAFTNSCLLMEMPPAQAGSTPAGLVVSHLLDPVPTEIHVFTAMTSGLPLFVMIGQPPRQFEVTGRGIERVR